jgi:hypothetical protein
MQSALNPMMNVYQTQLDASRRCMEALFSGIEQADRLILDTTHRMLNQQLTLVQSIASGGDPKSAMTLLQPNFMSQGPMETMNSQRELMAIFTEMQNAIGKSLEEYMRRLSAGAPIAKVGAVMQQDNVQRQADISFNPVTGIFAAWEAAFRDATELARKSVATTRSTIEEAAIAGARNAAAFTAVPTVVDEAGAAARRTTMTGTAADRSASDVESGQDGEERRGTTGKRK